MPKPDASQQQLTVAPANKNEPLIKEQRATGEFKLAGTMGSQAIINDKVVVAGDEVDGAKVIAITAGTVKILYKNKELILKM